MMFTNDGTRARLARNTEGESLLGGRQLDRIPHGSQFSEEKRTTYEGSGRAEEDEGSERNLQMRWKFAEPILTMHL